MYVPNHTYEVVVITGALDLFTFLIVALPRVFPISLTFLTHIGPDADGGFTFTRDQTDALNQVMSQAAMPLRKIDMVCSDNGISKFFIKSSTGSHRTMVTGSVP